MKKKNLIVVKSNMLNTMLFKKVNTTGLKLMSIYLSQVNPRTPYDKINKTLSISKEDYYSLTGIKDMKKERWVEAADLVLDSRVHDLTEIENPHSFSVFNAVSVENDKINISITEAAIPYVYNLKSQYFKYKLWNVLQLNSVNQIRMYELLKQYELIGKLCISLENIKEYLSIDKDEYKLFKDFKNRVLDACQKALQENTDIKFEYELIKGARGKVQEILFTISENKDYTIHLEEFVEEIKNVKVKDLPILPETLSLKEVANRLFEDSTLFRGLKISEKQVESLVELADQLKFVDKYHPVDPTGEKRYWMSKYFSSKIDEMKFYQAKGTRIQSVYGYIKSLVMNDIKEECEIKQTEAVVESSPLNNEEIYLNTQLDNSENNEEIEEWHDDIIDMFEDTDI